MSSNTKEKTTWIVENSMRQINEFNNSKKISRNFQF